MAIAAEPQAVPVIDADQVDAILKTLDRALVVHRERLAFVEQCKNLLPFYHQAHSESSLCTFFEHHTPCSEYAIRLWASANNFAIREYLHESAECRFRVMTVVVGTDDLVSWHGRSEWQKPAAAEPANVITPPPEVWRPADAADNDTRASLGEID